METNIDELVNRITCCKRFDLIKKLPDKCIDLAIISPLNGLVREFLGQSFSEDELRKWEEKFLPKDLFLEICRVSKQQILIGCRYDPETSCYPVFVNAGQYYQVDSNDVWKRFTDEMIKVSFKPREVARMFICYHDIPGKRSIHDFVKEYTKEGDLVLDVFCGTGNADIVCDNLNRRFISLSEDEEYTKIAQERLNEHRKFKQNKAV